MASSLLLRGARQLVTLRGPDGPRRGADLKELGVIPDGAILVVNGIIHSVGPSRRVENLAEARHAEVLSVEGCVVLPGFVDADTQLVGAPSRHSEASRVFGTVVQALRNTPAKRLEMQGRHMLSLFLRHGTTSIAAKSGYGLDAMGEIKTLRVLEELSSLPVDIYPSYFGARSLPREFEDSGRYLEFMLQEMLPRVARRGLAKTVDVDPAGCGFDWDQTAAFLKAAHMHRFPTRVHCGGRGEDFGVEAALTYGSRSVAGLQHLSHDQMRHLAASPLIGVLMPGLGFHDREHRYPDARRLVDTGAAIALGSGYDPYSSPTCSMQMVISLACSELGLTPAEAVTASTVNAAWSIGAGQIAGSLESGKKADMIVCAVPDFREIASQFGVNLVHSVVKDGAVVYRQQNFTWQVA